MRILGIDPGLHVTGYGLIEVSPAGDRLVEAGVIRTDESLSLAERLRQLAADLDTVVANLNPREAAIEDLYAHYEHPRTAIIMGHARGAILLSVARAGLPVTTYAATHIKKSLVGNGRATKAQMQQMVRVTFGLRATPEPPDAADALAVALCHGRIRAAAGVPEVTAR